MKRVIRLLDSGRRFMRLDRQLDDIKVNQGRILAELNSRKTSARLADYEFKIFSQSGEDGIIQFLISHLAIKNRAFIEFGVEDFLESNCRFLLMKDGWRGFVVDGSARNLLRLQNSRFYWRHSLTHKTAFITRENIREILEESGLSKDLGILSVDIDGVDFYVLSELEDWTPSILIVEYNALFGRDRPVSVPYDAAFQRSQKHFSNLYYGASLAAFHNLLGHRGYAFVGANSAGNNAFFVRRELLAGPVSEVSIADGFRDSTFREGRNERRELTFAAGNARRTAIAELPLIDTVSGEHLRVRDLGA